MNRFGKCIKSFSNSFLIAKNENIRQERIISMYTMEGLTKEEKLKKLATGEIWLTRAKILDCQSTAHHSKLLYELDSLKFKLDNRIHNDQQIYDKIWATYMHSITHHNTAIEGNKLSIHDSKVLWDTFGMYKSEELLGISQEEFRKTLKNDCTKRDCIEVLQHLNAYQYTRKLMAKGIVNIEEDDIINLNTWVMGKSHHDWVAEGLGFTYYRKTPLRVLGSSTVRPLPYEIPAIMQQFIRWKTKELAVKTEHPVIIAARIHSNLLHIHPFSDGNGRTARLLLLLSLQNLGYYGINIENKDRNEYMTCLEELQNNEPVRYFEFILQNNLRFMKDLFNKELY
jgi:hypothetical protein